MAYTNRQKADFYRGKFEAITFSPTLSKIYWRLYVAYDNADKALKDLDVFKKRNAFIKQNS